MPGKKASAKSSKPKRPAAKTAAKSAATRKVAARPKASPPPKSAAPKPAALVKTTAPAPAVPERKIAGPAQNSMSTLIRVNPPASAESVDDADNGDNGLLAGPRNVQPYIAKRGEQYMNKEQLDHFRTILLTWKRDLMVEVDRTVSHMKDEAANFPDPNDRATQEEEFSLELRTRDRERKLIRKIDEALKRVDDGSYGYCLETGEEIGVKRLEARPVATLSLEAQERRERRERQYGDRDDRYR